MQAEQHGTQSNQHLLPIGPALQGMAQGLNKVIFYNLHNFFDTLNHRNQPFRHQRKLTDVKLILNGEYKICYLKCVYLEGWILFLALLSHWHSPSLRLVLCTSALWHWLPGVFCGWSLDKDAQCILRCELPLVWEHLSYVTLSKECVDRWQKRIKNKCKRKLKLVRKNLLKKLKLPESLLTSWYGPHTPKQPHWIRAFISASQTFIFGC